MHHTSNMILETIHAQAFQKTSYTHTSKKTGKYVNT